MRTSMNSAAENSVAVQSEMTSRSKPWLVSQGSTTPLRRSEAPDRRPAVLDDHHAHAGGRAFGQRAQAGLLTSLRETVRAFMGAFA